MKILHVLQSNKFSGAENVVCAIVDMFKEENEMVYCSPKGDIETSLKERNIKYSLLEKLSKKELKKVVDKENPDIIHAHDRYASILAAQVARNIPIVVHMHVNNNKGIKLFLKNIIWTKYSMRFSHIFWVSKSSFTGFPFNKLLKEKSSILYNVLDCQKIIERSNKDDKNYDYDIVYCGRLSYQKNPEFLMRIIHEVIKKKKDIKVAIIGSGEYEDYIKN